ncbi:pantoate--beta-alanine ligase [Membranihabitans marinus]|uniref:pantoate--beta-alanine ligase n=1 Tax=Membranihabitans marinus TaxID=1227546 RepID=UPI001F003A34|nr:pantoate--beta-alanine ligase [Membranihabitans marinus]
MFLFKTELALRQHLDKISSKPIGFVPTMGALHRGHESLIEASKDRGCYTVASIFVNPTQFNDKSDLEKYPRTVDADLELLYHIGCDAVFCPAVSEVYKEGKAPVPNVDLGHLGNTLEAAFRKGHFEGVMQVVARLLDMVRPQMLFMGQKDLQQLTIIQHMIQQLGIEVDLIPCPIVRQSSGLAISSRNSRLDEEVLPHVHLLHDTLMYCRQQFSETPISALKEEACKKLDLPFFKLEYLEFLNAQDLTILSSHGDADNVVAVLAVWANDVRLIDNMLVHGKF